MKKLALALALALTVIVGAVSISAVSSAPVAACPGGSSNC
jgi:hypothetical protein